MSIQGLHSAYSGLRTNQAALETTSHNIANVGTKGYTRQRVETSTLGAIDKGYGYVGTGVDIDDIVRLRETFLDERVRSESARAGYTETRADLLQSVEQIFGDIDGGMLTDLDQLFGALDDLALRPELAANGEIALQEMQNVASRIREQAGVLQNLRTDAGRDLVRSVDQVNGMLADLAELNRAIAGSGGGASPNDLLDQRDMLVDELTRMTGGTLLVGSDGTARFIVQGQSLVDGVTVRPLTAAPDGTITSSQGTNLVLEGSLGARQRFLTNDLTTLQNSLDQFATTLADAFNTRNAQGVRSDDTPGEDLFDASLGAVGFSVVATEEWHIARAQGTYAAYDGRNAANLANLRTDDLGSGSLLEQFREIVVGVGGDVASARRAAESAKATFSAAGQARESFHGVNLDEEMVNLVSFQRGLEAASRVLTAMDEVLNVLVNRTGIVGR